VPHFAKHWAETFAWGELSGEENMVGFLGLDSCGQEFTFIEGTEDWNWCGAKLLFDVTVRGLGPLNIRRSLPCIGMKS